MKKLIITTFIIGLSTSAFANGEDLDKLFSYSLGADDVQTTGAQPQIGNSRSQEVMKMMNESNNIKWYDIQDGS